MAVRDGVISSVSPTINADFATNKSNKNYYGFITMDSGAALSYVHEDCLKYCDYNIAGPRPGNFYGAGGDKLKLAPHLVDLRVSVPKIGKLSFKNVLVARSDKPSLTMLVGRSDLERMKVVVNFAEGTVVIGNNEPIRMAQTHGRETAVIYTVSHDDLQLKPEDADNILTRNEIKSDDLESIVVNVGEPCILANTDHNTIGDNTCNSECEKCVNRGGSSTTLFPSQDPAFTDNPTSWMIKRLERIRQRDRETFSHKDVTIDPIGAARHPKAAAGIRAMCEEFKDVFAGDIGKFPDEYAVGGVIKGCLAKTRVGQNQFKGEVQDAVIEQFLRQAAHGVIGHCETDGIEPKNIMRILAVAKKDDDGNTLKPTQGTRIVVNSTTTNDHTDYCGTPTHNLEHSLDFAARFTKSGLVAKVDIANCYPTCPIKPELYPYFCVVLPILGVWYYKRVVQGWNKAAQAVQNAIDKIFWQLAPYTGKYMDDFILATEDTEDDFLAKLRIFFVTCRRNNIRLKGKKVFFLMTKFNYLGFVIVDGAVAPNEHYVNKLVKVSYADIVTKGHLKSYAGGIGFIARFLKRSQEVLKPLQIAMAGEPKEKVEKTPELEKAFEKAKRALMELSRTHPFNPKLDTVMVVDTSLLHTGGFIYQINSSGDPQLTGFFSRSRTPKEQKLPRSSCMMELLGLLAFVTAYLDMLTRAEKVITIITDSASLVKLFARFQNQDMVSSDTVINNALYTICCRLKANIIHMKNHHAMIQFSDTLSRITHQCGLPMPESDCSKDPSCKVCDAARAVEFDIENAGRAVSAVCAEARRVCPEVWSAEEAKFFGHPSDLEAVALRRMPLINEVTFSAVKTKRYTLRSLLDDHAAVEAMQEKCADLRKVRKGLRNGRVNYPGHEARLQRMMEIEQAKLENGVLKLLKRQNGEPVWVIPLPQCAGPIAVAAVHETVGHRSIAQIVKMAARYFWFPKIREMVTEFVNNCVRCSLERGGGNFTRQKMKPVPLPTEFFTTILMDEMTRSYRGKNVKIAVAMEGISQFIIAVVYEGAMTGEMFCAILAHCKTVLCPHGMDNIKVKLRLDAATWHTSTVVREALAVLNVELQLHSSTKFSKNQVPELDIKMRNLGDHLRGHFEKNAVSAEIAVHLAVAQCNSTIGDHGLTPAEAFCGRGWRDNELIKVDAKQLLQHLERRREFKRTYEERKAAQRKQDAELKLVPYDDPELNSPLVNNVLLTKIREGDIVQIKVNRGKNEVPTAWIVQKVNFQKKLLLVKKTSGLETGQSESRWISFEIVHRVFHSENAVYQIQRGLGPPIPRDAFQKFIMRSAALAAHLSSAPSVPADLDLVHNLHAMPMKQSPPVKEEFVWVAPRNIKAEYVMISPSTPSRTSPADTSSEDFQTPGEFVTPPKTAGHVINGDDDGKNSSAPTKQQKKKTRRCRLESPESPSKFQPPRSARNINKKKPTYYESPDEEEPRKKLVQDPDFRKKQPSGKSKSKKLPASKNKKAT